MFTDYEVLTHTSKLKCYNFARIHQMLRVTPAMQAGISDHVWSFQEIVAFTDQALEKAA